MIVEPTPQNSLLSCTNTIFLKRIKLNDDNVVAVIEIACAWYLKGKKLSRVGKTTKFLETTFANQPKWEISRK